ncbi:MAG TPA: hypothetical protein VI007_13775 [bacterium]
MRALISAVVLIFASLPVTGALPVIAQTAPPAAAATPAGSYFPLSVGATWVRRNDDGAEVTIKVLGTKTVAGAGCTILETRTTGRLGAVRVCYEQTSDGVRALETQGLGITLVLDPPRPTLELPPQAGRSWSWTPKNVPFSMTVTDTWVLEESIRVPAGSFTAWKLQSIAKRGSTTATVTTWYAPGVGPVKVVREENGERDSEGSSELVSYRFP